MSKKPNPNKKFINDPEAEENVKSLRLPFALCQKNGIEIQDWWTPRNAWEALRGENLVDNVSEEYKEYFRKLKKKSAKRSAIRTKAKNKQLNDPEHNPNYDYIHQEGKIAGVEKQKPMNHKEADSGNVNPNIKKAFDPTFNPTGTIGYRTNCSTCVATYVARRLGYDVEALPNLNNVNVCILSSQSNLAYLDENGKHPNYILKPKGTKNATWLNDNIKDNELFSVQFQYVGRNSGHIITAFKENGTLKIYDPQTNTEYNDLNHYGNITKVKIMNLTNCSIDTKFCDTIMKPKKKQVEFDSDNDFENWDK